MTNPQTTQFAKVREIRKKHSRFIFWEFGEPHIGYEWMNHPSIQNCLAMPLPTDAEVRNGFAKQI